MDHLSVTIIQDILHWHDPAGNRAMYDAHFGDIDETDLVVLPEMFSSGFSMEPKACYETMDGETVAWMLKKASEKDVVITGSLIMHLSGETFVNRLDCGSKPESASHNKQIRQAASRRALLRRAHHLR